MMAILITPFVATLEVTLMRILIKTTGDSVFKPSRILNAAAGHYVKFPFMYSGMVPKGL